jgi:DNA processing protein
VSDARYWLGFSLIPEIGPRRLAMLRDAFSDLGLAWAADETGLRCAGFDGKPLTNILRARDRIDLDAQMAKVKSAGARVIPLDDPDYPPLLRMLPDAPMLLYVRGTLTEQDERALSIVGTRKATAYGRDAAYHFAKQLAAQDVTIVSGMAHGIDAAAHRGALDAGGRTIAVFGCGIDQIYPRDHAALASEIAGRGALISEFPIGTPPEARNFPRRNRIISGLSLGVLVVEAPEHSGALITTTAAADQGRDVFAIPGNIFSPASRGANRLIQDGAKLVMDVDDILAELNPAHVQRETRRVAEQVAPENDTEAALLQYLSPDPIHIDDLSRLSDLPIATVSSTLTILELKGMAQMVGHMQYRLAY